MLLRPVTRDGAAAGVREFSEIQQQLGLARFMATPVSSLHYVPAGPNAPMIMVRHFHTELMPPSLVGPCARLGAAFADWVACRPFVTAAVSVPQPLEVGTDFISRTFFSFGTATDAYDAGSVDPPPELAWMRDAVSDALGATPGTRAALLETIVARCLLQPSAKVFLDDGKFVVIEPHVSPEDLRRWAELESGTDRD